MQNLINEFNNQGSFKSAYFSDNKDRKIRDNYLLKQNFFFK